LLAGFFIENIIFNRSSLHILVSDFVLGLRLVIPIIVKVIDRRYLQRAIASFNKTIRIRHEEERYDEALNLASFHLNPLGMDQYYKCIKELVRRRTRLEVTLVDGSESGSGANNPRVAGIAEKYKNVKDPVKYGTTPNHCYCKRFFKKGLCLHILFIREYYGF
jgi:hypothetical protein